jgi:hypothetical protein
MQTIRVDRSHDDRVRLTAGDRVLAEYVHRPSDPQLESPRPYLSPIHTLAGEVVSLYRPHDHVWHKGIAWSLPVVGDENFWGGPTFVRGEGYVQLPNNGTQRHRGFADAPATLDATATSDAPADGPARVVEALEWVTESGESLFEERRTLAAAILDAEATGSADTPGAPDAPGMPDAPAAPHSSGAPSSGAWLLAFETRMRNVTEHAIPIGSPTTRGRENAGYGGLFWRGPRSFTGGDVLAPDIVGGDELRGMRAPWMGFSGRHDGSGGASTVVMIDDPANVQHPPQWFARRDEFACLCPAQFFSEEHIVEPGATLALRYGVVVADGASGSKRAARLAAAASVALHDLLER